MSAAREEHHMSVEAYKTLEAANPDIRYEYLDGEVFMMSGGSFEHSVISVNCITYLNLALGDSACQVLNSDAKVQLNDWRFVYPDVSISCFEVTGENKIPIREPKLIIEVLSPGTETYDRTKKLSDYKECPSIDAILLISQQQPQVEAYLRRTSDLWDVHIYGQDDTIALEALSIELSIAQIYRRVTFSQ